MSVAPDRKSSRKVLDLVTKTKGGVWIAYAAVLAFVSTWVAMGQDGLGPGELPPERWSARWWSLPLESHPEAKHDGLAGRVHDTASNSKGDVWAVGAGGLLEVRRGGEGAWEPVPILLSQSEYEELFGRAASRADELRYLGPLEDMGPGLKEQAAKGYIAIGRQESGGRTELAPVAREGRFLATDLNAIAFAGSLGIVVGDFGVYLRTVDDGETWQFVSHEHPFHLYDVHLGSTNYGVVAGEEGVVLHLFGEVEGLIFDRVPGRLQAIHVMPDERAWLATDGGVFFSPSRKTTERLENGAFYALDFPDDRSGWAVGTEGRVFVVDGEKTTARKPVEIDGAAPTLVEVHQEEDKLIVTAEMIGEYATRGYRVVGERAPGEVGDDLRDVELAWGEATHLYDRWNGDSRPGSIRSPWSRRGASRIGVSGPNVVWVLDSDGAVRVSENGGASWTAYELPDANTVWTHASFTDADHGVVAGEVLGDEPLGVVRGILRGKLLDSLEVGVPESLWAGSAKQLFICTSSGKASSDNGGSSWTRVETEVSYRLFAVPAVPGAAWRSEGEFSFSTTNGGLDWKARGAGPAMPGSAFPVTEGWGFLLNESDEGNGVYVTGEDGEYERRDSRGSPLEWTAAVRGAFRNQEAGWLIGERCYQTLDGGRTWKRATTLDADGRLLEPSDLAFGSEQNGWMLASPGRLLRTTDGGVTWTDVVEHQRYPAPWYYLAMFLWGGIATVGLRKIETGEKEEPKTAGRFLNPDAPLQDGAGDVLGFGPIARGLARFLANPNTEPPLTVAITGEWGSGKSSMMNLLKARVRQRSGFRCVWFNAWHHQKEEHLLAAMLQSIQREGVPSLWSSGGVPFRLSLLWRRIRRNLGKIFTTVLAAAAGAWALSWIARFVQQSSLSEFETDGTIEQAWSKLLSLLQEDPQKVGGVSIIALLGWGLLNSLRAFAQNPASLLSLMRDKSSQGDVGRQLGYRARFQQEFDEVTRALGRQRLMLFIDDLDRCQPKQVMEVLEAVNFLSSCGQVIVVLGMAEERVARCVRDHFKDVADAEYRKFIDEARRLLPGAAEKRDVEVLARELSRRSFADQYLRKLVNLRVPVPIRGAEQSKALFDKKLHEELAERASSERWRPRLAQAGRAVVVGAVLVGLVASGVLTLPPDLPSQAAASSASVPDDPSQLESDEGEGQSDPVDPAPSGTESDPNVAQPVRVDDLVGPERNHLVAGRPASAPLSLFGGVLLAFVALIGWRLRALDREEPRDSDTFTEALGRWLGLVYERTPTPREAKRFVNRARYKAMMRSGLDEVERGMFSTVLRFLLPGRKKAGGEEKDQGSDVLSDSDIVAFCGLEAIAQGVVREEGKWQELLFALSKGDVSLDGWQQGELDRLRTTLAELDEANLPAPFTEEKRLEWIRTVAPPKAAPEAKPDAPA